MDFFVVQLILSFIIGGFYVAFAIWIAEKFGSKLGGIIVSLPSTLLVSLVFIAWTQNTQAALDAIPIVPVAIAAIYLFVIVYIHYYKDLWVWSFAAGLIVWGLSLTPLIAIGLDNMLVSVAISIVLFTIGIKYLKRFPHRKIPMSKQGGELVIRMLLAGSIVTLSVFLGKTMGPIWGGLMGSFPAAVAPTLILLTISHGIDYASSVSRTMPFGSIGNVLFAIVFYFSTPLIGVVWGLLAGYTTAVVYTIILLQTVLNEKHANRHSRGNL